MPTFATRLVDRVEVAEGTMAFLLARPENFDFLAGQFVHVVLPNPPHRDAGGNRRTFSIASPPHKSATLQVVTRLTGSAMKRSLAEVELGTTVEILGPAGSFTLDADASNPAVFIAGGIGITPFRSMIHDVIGRRLPHRITLVYSNRTPEGTAFHEEFVGLASEHPGFTYIPTMTQPVTSRPSWTGERRHVNAEFLHDRLGDLSRLLFYVAGPPGFVGAVTAALVEAGTDPSRVRSEEFDGY